MLRFHYVALIVPNSSETDADRMLLGVYVDEGDNEGLYTTDETAMLCRWKTHL